MFYFSTDLIVEEKKDISDSYGLMIHCLLQRISRTEFAQKNKNVYINFSQVKSRLRVIQHFLLFRRQKAADDTQSCGRLGYNSTAIVLLGATLGILTQALERILRIDRRISKVDVRVRMCLIEYVLIFIFAYLRCLTVCTSVDTGIRARR